MLILDQYQTRESGKNIPTKRNLEVNEFCTKSIKFLNDLILEKQNKKTEMFIDKVDEDKFWSYFNQTAKELLINMNSISKNIQAKVDTLIASNDMEQNSQLFEILRTIKKVDFTPKEEDLKQFYNKVMELKKDIINQTKTTAFTKKSEEDLSDFEDGSLSVLSKKRKRPTMNDNELSKISYEEEKGSFLDLNLDFINNDETKINVVNEDSMKYVYRVLVDELINKKPKIIDFYVLWDLILKATDYKVDVIANKAHLVQVLNELEKKSLITYSIFTDEITLLENRK